VHRNRPEPCTEWCRIGDTKPGHLDILAAGVEAAGRRQAGVLIFFFVSGRRLSEEEQEEELHSLCQVLGYIGLSQAGGSLNCCVTVYTVQGHQGISCRPITYFVCSV
jgi:hypothetical protein